MKTIISVLINTLISVGCLIINIVKAGPIWVGIVLVIIAVLQSIILGLAIGAKLHIDFVNQLLKCEEN